MTQDWALFLDFDGTLVEIAPRPDAVVVPRGLPDILAVLRDKLGGALALISGRSIATLDAALAPYRFDAAGLHGLEYRCAGVLHGCDPASRPELRRALAELRERLSSRRGIVIEDKGCAVAVHWRMAPDEQERALQAAKQTCLSLGNGYRLQPGRMVAEIVPAKSDKGQAIATFLRQQPFSNRRALFIGDDVTDEHGFEIVNALGGVSVRVGRGMPSKARYVVNSPAELRERLACWASSGHIDPEPQFSS
jgi:trehalose 6-phosphate phosphatase